METKAKDIARDAERISSTIPDKVHLLNEQIRSLMSENNVLMNRLRQAQKMLKDLELNSYRCGMCGGKGEHSPKCELIHLLKNAGLWKETVNEQG